MNTHKEEQETIYESSAYNPFPEPQTIPSGWDLSELISTPEVEFSTDEDNKVES